jgi:hypothetical protein
MMRPEFMVPGHFDAEQLHDVLEMVGVTIGQASIGRWSRFEQIVAYDWAVRKYLVASDHPKRLLRDKPRFVITAQVTDSSHLGALVRATYGKDERLVCEGIMLGTSADGTIIIQASDGEQHYCWPLLDFERLPEAVRAGAR